MSPAMHPRPASLQMAELERAQGMLGFTIRIGGVWRPLIGLVLAPHALSLLSWTPYFMPLLQR